MDEDARLATLRSKFVLDTAPDVTLDALVAMCAEIFHVPVALVSLVDQHRQWFKAKHNFEANATGRAESFCAWTMLCDDRKVLVVRDATTDAMFKDNPLVTDGPKIRFYAGAPLVVDDVVFGSICLIDYEKHDAPAFFDEAAAARLRAIHAIVSYRPALPRARAAGPESDVGFENHPRRRGHQAKRLWGRPLRRCRTIRRRAFGACRVTRARDAPTFHSPPKGVGPHINASRARAASTPRIRSRSVLMVPTF